MARRPKAGIANQGPEVEQSSLGGIINRELRNSLTYDQSQISQKRAITLEYVRGIMPDLPGRPNGSQQTSRDIADVVGWILPGIIRTLTASDEMVRYESVKDENPDFADQATSYMNWSFMYDNDGYRVLYNGTKDSLEIGNGVVRGYIDPEQTKNETHTGLTMQDVAELLQEAENGSIRILSQRAGVSRETEDEDGKKVKEPTVDLKIERITSKGRLCHETCKPENLLINAAATTLEDARFVAYLHDDYTRSDLLEMGFPKDLVEGLAPGPNFARNQVELARRYDLTTNWQSPVRSGDRIDTYEVYIRADADGDGIAEMLQVWYAGTIGAGVVLAWDYWEDDLPFTDIPCYPVQHRWDAESVSDRTVDIQRVKTTLLRSVLDNTYWSAAPQRVAVEGSILNPDALVNPRFGSTLWAKKGTDPNNAVVPLTIPYTGDKALAAMQAMDEVVTKRTGVSRSTMALDPEALTNQTATANQNMQDAGYSQVELIARNQTEYGWNKHFAKCLRLAVKYLKTALIPATQDQSPIPGQQAPKFQQVDPSQWDAAMSCVVKTGLGTGSRDRDMAMLKVVMDSQVAMATQLAGTGLPSAKLKALEFLPKIVGAAKLLAESAGLKNPSMFYPDITDQDVQQMAKEAQDASQQPNGEAQLLQLKMQGEQATQQSAQQIAQIRGQAEMASAQSNLQIKQLQVQDAQREAGLKDQVAGLELKLQAAKADADNATKLKSQALNNLTQIIVAGLNNKAALDTTMVEGWLESIIGIQGHQQNLEMAGVNAALAPQPDPTLVQ